MKKVQNFEFPPELVPVFKKAKQLEWLTVIYLLVTLVIMYLTMGNSQAMKIAWVEDVISLVPSLSFLIASRIFVKPTTIEFPLWISPGNKYCLFV